MAQYTRNIMGVERDMTPAEIAEYLRDLPLAVVPKSLSKIDQDTLNDALAAEGSVLRAFALLVLEDRNNMANAVANATSLTDLRSRFPKAITTPQFVSLLKAKMRN